MPSQRNEPLLVQIPPSTSPLLIPADSPASASSHSHSHTHSHAHSHGHSHRYSNSTDSFTLNRRNPDIPDDLEFVAPGQWDESIQQFREDEEYEDGVDEDEDDVEDADIEDWTLEEGHIEGVPCANVRMNAKHYQSTDFLQQLFNVLRHDLAIPGWSYLPPDTPPTLIQVHKVSGSLTNAVFFVSIPETPIELDHIEPLEFSSSAVGESRTPVLSNSQLLAPSNDPESPPFVALSPATVFSELEKGRSSATTPTPVDRSVTPPVLEEAPSTPCASVRNLPLFDSPSSRAQNNDHSRDPSNASSTTATSYTSSTATSASDDHTMETETILFSAPTLLLRIYGPSSGSLISRRNELHILHTLSSQYGIGPRVLGTFANGRVEEYFHSRALVKEEMRDPRVSRWIGRRMRELHSVDLEQMIRPLTEEEALAKSAASQAKELQQNRNNVHAWNHREDSSQSPPPSQQHQDSGERPGLDRNFSSGASCHSISSSSSLFSFGTSSSSSCHSYSSSTADSVASNSTIGSPSIYGTPRSVVSSPSLLPQRPALESRASSKKRPRRKIGSRHSSHRKEQTKLCVWENITRWTREAKIVLNELDQLASIPGFSGLLDKPVKSMPTSRTTSSSSTSTQSTTNYDSVAAAPSTSIPPSLTNPPHIPPLASPSRTLNLRASLNLPLFEQQLRLYRTFVHARERTSGRSKRVFAHNDTQYGNLLLLTPEQGGQEEEELERRVKREGGNHKRIIVVDFEYAGANPRGFDIANHFCEWQADYHHETLSHSLSAHQPYPTRFEKIRFLRAYVGCDGGYDQQTDQDQPQPPSQLQLQPHQHQGEGREDPRVEKLLDEVQTWGPSSHAMWAVWGIVQAKEDLLARIEGWKLKAADKVAANPPPEPRETTETSDELLKEIQELDLEREATKEGQRDDASQVDSDDEEWEAVEGEVFDYLSYAAERMDMFRKELTTLGVI